jgi:hypothetical protein
MMVMEWLEEAMAESVTGAVVAAAMLTRGGM